ncbi:MAG TPA: hypothetical protein VE465_09500 [Streptosporangiaceae bacterium]|nr:hypothetical protein [Streptosporangiaceae bacterium]
MMGIAARPVNTWPESYAAWIAAALASVRGAGRAMWAGGGPTPVRLRALHGSGSCAQPGGVYGQPSGRMSAGGRQPPTRALRSRNRAGLSRPSRTARSPYCTPTLSHVRP